MTSSRGIAVLLYHHVGPLREPACQGLTVLTEAFERQISTLSAMGYAAIVPDDWAAVVRGDGDIPEHSVMITFDDAYADLVEYALPVLEHHGYPAVVFVPTSLVGRTINCNPNEPGAQLPIMSAEQIATWTGRGVTFGAHSRTHADLTSLSLDDAVAEIDGSRDDLAALTGRATTTFAYPYGKLNDQVASLVRTRFHAAFTIEEGVNDVSVPLHLLRRTMVQHHDTMVDVLLRARYGRSVLQRVRSAVRGRTSETSTA
jgi:peptidoglycan/xylan/chitin deacetylase (PgdA/CDA1 family)